MPPKTGSPGEVGENTTPDARRSGTKILGKDIPNLVIIRDSGDAAHVEFRVQCEVVLKAAELDGDEADPVMQYFRGPRTRETNRRLKEFVLDRVHPLATERFRKIVGLAFDDQPEMR